ncbi:epithelial membrane protein 3-like [Physella acuta]|uniref:epithelial membrane protein 3-like n=1 Tax=Physella acuta TaxID=109671 RepID=UPI0027DE1105|nr:epithelial membrane protein 3-like [Physella acuta]
MGVKDGFMGAHILIKIAFIIVLVAQLCNWISFCTSSWYIVYNVVLNGNNKYTHFGLWRSCVRSELFTTSDGCKMLDGAASDWFAATQAFAVFGFVLLNVGCLLLILFMFYGSCKGKSEAMLASGICLIASAVTWILAVIIYGAKVDDLYGDNNFDFGFSFALAICALILALVSGILVVVASKKGGSVSSK